MKNQKFPDGFLWGAGTSSHQIEGNTNNDWTEWEKLPGKIKTGEVSGKAANSWELYEKDFDLLEQMNLKAYRFSVEWSRVEPEQGKFDQSAIDRYKDMLISLKKRGITPVVTIHHFTNPLWLADWSTKKVISPYLNYVEKLVSELGEHVHYWITINEPNVFAYMGYQTGVWPPGKNNILQERKVLKVMHSAHRQAYARINKIYKSRNWQKPMISMAFNLQHFVPLDNDFATKITAKFAGYLNNDYNISRTLKSLDFIGVNHYFSHWVKGFSVNNDPEDIPRNDLFWPMYPEGLYLTLKDIKKYSLPILITENGIPDSEDKKRAWFIGAYVAQVHRAIEDGIGVIGYMHWSLIDNWEWWDGFGGRFGLAETNFDTFERKLRKSGEFYGQIAKNNSLPDEMPELKP
jgi:beta-glucosidase